MRSPPETPARSAQPAGRISQTYPGATYLLIDAESWQDQDWLSDLVRATAAELPTPRPRPAKAPKKAS